MNNNACYYCANGWFCDCGAANQDDVTFIYASAPQKPSYHQLRLFNEQFNQINTDAIKRLNYTIKEAQTWKEDTTSWTEWIATGRTLLRATLRKTKSRLYSLLWIGR